MKRVGRQLLLTGVALGFVGCPDGSQVQVGVVAPTTGEWSLYGQPVANGIQLAFEEIQQRDGYPFALTLNVVDSESDPAKAKTLLDELYSGGAIAAIGGVTSDEALEMIDVADRYDRVLLSPSASTPELTGISKYFYRVFPSDFLEGSKMGNFATQTLELKEVAILAAESVYGIGIQKVFQTEFERYGGKIVEVIEYPVNTSDFDALIDRLVTLRPEAIYIADFAGASGTLVRALREGGYKGHLLTPSSFATAEALAVAGRHADGVFLTQPVFEADSEEEHIQRFVAAYSAKYGEEPGLYAAHGYDAMMVLADALQRGARATSNELWKGMRGVRDYVGVTGSLGFNERGDVKKFPRVYIVTGGGLRDYEQYAEAKRDEIKKRIEAIRRQTRRMSDSG